MPSPIPNGKILNSADIIVVYRAAVDATLAAISSIDTNSPSDDPNAFVQPALRGSVSRGPVERIPRKDFSASVKLRMAPEGPSYASSAMSFFARLRRDRCQATRNGGRFLRRRPSSPVIERIEGEPRFRAGAIKRAASSVVVTP